MENTPETENVINAGQSNLNPAEIAAVVAINPADITPPVRIETPAAPPTEDQSSPQPTVQPKDDVPEEEAEPDNGPTDAPGNLPPDTTGGNQQGDGDDDGSLSTPTIQNGPDTDFPGPVIHTPDPEPVIAASNMPADVTVSKHDGEYGAHVFPGRLKDEEDDMQEVIDRNKEADAKAKALKTINIESAPAQEMGSMRIMVDDVVAALNALTAAGMTAVAQPDANDSAVLVDPALATQALDCLTNAGQHPNAGSPLPESATDKDAAMADAVAPRRPGDNGEDTQTFDVTNAHRATQVLSDQNLAAKPEDEGQQVTVAASDAAQAQDLLQQAALSPQPVTDEDSDEMAKIDRPESPDEYTQPSQSGESEVTPEQVVALAEDLKAHLQVADDTPTTGDYSSVTVDSSESLGYPPVPVSPDNLTRIVKNPQHRKIFLEKLLNSDSESDHSAS